jgi:hypothetical protein
MFSTAVSMESLHFRKKPGRRELSPLNIRIENLFFDRLVVDVKSTTTAQTYSLKDGVLKVYDINVRNRTHYRPILLVNSISMRLNSKRLPRQPVHVFSCWNKLFCQFNTLIADSFAIQPNYTEYEFTGRHQFETDRLKAGSARYPFTIFLPQTTLNQEILQVHLLKSGNSI